MNPGAAFAPRQVRERVLVVDDDPSVARLLEVILAREGYRCSVAGSVAAADQRLRSAPYDVMLADVRLPDGSGLDLVEQAIRTDPRLAVLVVSGLDDVALADRALRMGASGYVVKPFSPNEVLVGVLGALAHRRRELSARDDLRDAEAETIRRLCAAVEARDTSTAAHSIGMSEICFDIARELGLPSERCELLRTASPMHDIGKVGMPDHVLLKPSGLTSSERELMERHAEIGYRILAGSRTELLQLAATIAWTHHERLDGSGYPRRLSGTEIPQEGRIAAVADVFDALTSDRVYRPRFSPDDALQIVADGRGRTFDAEVVDALASTVARGDPTASAGSGSVSTRRAGEGHVRDSAR